MQRRLRHEGAALGAAHHRRRAHRRHCRICGGGLPHSWLQHVKTLAVQRGRGARHFGIERSPNYEHAGIARRPGAPRPSRRARHGAGRIDLPPDVEEALDMRSRPRGPIRDRGGPPIAGVAPRCSHRQGVGHRGRGLISRGSAGGRVLQGRWRRSSRTPSPGEPLGGGAGARAAPRVVHADRPTARGARHGVRDGFPRPDPGEHDASVRDRRDRSGGALRGVRPQPGEGPSGLVRGGRRAGLALSAGIVRLRAVAPRLPTFPDARQARPREGKTFGSRRECGGQVDRLPALAAELESAKVDSSSREVLRPLERPRRRRREPERERVVGRP